MKAKGLVLAPRKYRGTVTPPSSWEDTSRFENDGVFPGGAADPTWTRLPSGLWVLDFVAANSELVTFGDCGLARTLVFWVSLDSLTESILEELAATGIIVTAGTIAYASWDNCYIDAVDTDTIRLGWHLVAITSTTDVDVSAFRVGLVNVTYLDGMVCNPRLFEYELSAAQIYSIFQKERGFFAV